MSAGRRSSTPSRSQDDYSHYSAVVNSRHYHRTEQHGRSKRGLAIMAARWRATYTGIRPPVEWRSDGDSVWVEQERFWVRAGRGAATCGKRAALGSLLGGLVGGLLAEDGLRAGAIAGGAVGCASVLD
jgi:hypothetical protein